MKLTAINSATGEEFSADAEAVTEESIRDLFDIDLSDDALKRMINNLNVSADVKSLLFSGALEIPCHFFKLKKRNDTCEMILILIQLFLPCKMARS